MRAGKLVLILGIAVAIPTLGLPQWITGPLVNALLILTVGWCGVTEAILVGMTTPLSAALRGVLPLPLLVMIPFIALGNAAFVATFAATKRISRWQPVVVAAVVKFGVLALAVTMLAAHPLSIAIGGAAQSIHLPPSIVSMMTWTQLATALAGGLVALGVKAAAERAESRRS
jgi:hypothetical protein